MGAVRRNRVRVSRALTPRARAGDTEEEDYQRAEVHLRLLADEELRRPAFTQLPRVPSLMPRSLATCAIGRPVSRTSRTAPTLKS